MTWLLARFTAGTERNERRHEARRKLRLELALPERSATPANVLDLTRTGMMIHTEAHFIPGDSFIVELPEAGEVEAQVVWKRLTLMGCRFVPPISRAALSAAILKAPKMSPPPLPPRRGGPR